MEINKNITELICSLEYIIGKQTYNPNSYNGWTGEEGLGFKYPVNYCQSYDDLVEDKYLKTKFKIEYMHPKCIHTMNYAFGSNHLYIGTGIVRILEFLEDRYGLNINDLEGNLIAKRRENMLLIKERLEANETISFSSEQRRRVVGIDIPEGTYIISKLDKRNYLSVNIYDENGKEVVSLFTENEEHIVLKNEYSISSYGYKLKLITDSLP